MNKTQATIAAKVAQLQHDSRKRMETLDSVFLASEKTAQATMELQDNHQRTGKTLQELKEKILKTISKREKGPPLNEEHCTATFCETESPHEQLPSPMGLQENLPSSSAPHHDTDAHKPESSGV